MKVTLILIGAVGSVLYALLFLLTFTTPEMIEKSGKGFIQKQITKEVKQKYKNSPISSTADKALALATKFGLEEQKLKSALKNDLPKKIAEVIGAMCGYDCEKKKAMAASITKSYVDKIANFKIAQHSLEQIVKGKYIEIVGKLKLDLRIFLGSNALIFLCILLLSFLRPVAIKHLFLPAALLTVACVISSCFYVFGQDWFYTIIYNDYMGFGYLAYVGVIFSLLVDITMNRARVTTEIINAILNAIGSAFQVVPC